MGRASARFAKYSWAASARQKGRAAERQTDPEVQQTLEWRKEGWILEELWRRSDWKEVEPGDWQWVDHPPEVTPAWDPPGRLAVPVLIEGDVQARDHDGSRTEFTHAGTAAPRRQSSSTTALVP